MANEVRTLYRVEGPEASKTGSKATYTLLPEDQNGKPIDVQMDQIKAWLRGAASEADAEGVVSHPMTGNYSIVFVPQDPGEYYLDVHYAGKPIYKRGDITLQVSGHSPRVRAKLGFEFAGQGFHSGRVGTKAEFKVWTKDENNKPADIDVYALEVHVEGPGGKDTGNVFSDGPGVYVCTYIVTAPGNYEVKVKYDDNVVATKNVPFSDVTRASKSVIGGIPMNKVPPKDTFNLTIQSKDMFDNVVNTGGDEWRCTTTGTGAAMIQITDRLDGTYLAGITLPTPGVYYLDFRLNGEQAKDCPVKITCGQ